MKAKVRIVWTKTYLVEVDTDNIGDLTNDLESHEPDTIDRIDRIVGERYDNPDSEEFTYSVVDE